MSDIYGYTLGLQAPSKPYTQITATFPSGTTNITLTGNGKTWPAVSTSSTQNVYMVTDIGYTYTLSGSKDGSSKSKSISVDQAFQDIRIELKFNPEWYESLKTQSVGQTLTVDGYEWIIVHKTTTAATLGLRYWYKDTRFGINTLYPDSDIAYWCATFESDTLSATTKAFLNNVTVPHDITPYETYDVTAKVWIPSKAQFESGFSYYATQSNRIFKNSGGTAKYTWTSSLQNSTRVWSVSEIGALARSDPASSYGFRPHIEVNLTL